MEKRKGKKVTAPKLKKQKRAVTSKGGLSMIKTRRFIMSESKESDNAPEDFAPPPLPLPALSALKGQRSGGQRAWSATFCQGACVPIADITEGPVSVMVELPSIETAAIKVGQPTWPALSLSGPPSRRRWLYRPLLMV
ncbi:hypothetical protein ABZP36_020905 [Zizania latifolia]